MWSQLYLTLIVFQLAYAKIGFGPTEQDWGYVTVRGTANIFWWLHCTLADVEEYGNKPLIIWLQGGPGSSSTGFGNFYEIGPLDTNLEYRNTSWVQWANILFVDNPAGTGFSYVLDNKDFVKNNTQIAEDFLIFLKKFYELVPEFKGVPLYIFGESYGGKMAADIALVIDQATKKGEIEANLKGVGLGDSWISPVDSILAYAPYLLNVGQVNQEGHDKIMDLANNIKIAVDENDMESAWKLWKEIQNTVTNETNGTDLYNILEKKPGYGLINNRNITDQRVNNIMNINVKGSLDLTSTWIEMNHTLHNALSLDFMNPVTKIVEKLLNETNLTVTVYNGQLDLIVPTPGTLKWIEKLNFKDKPMWDASPRYGFEVDGFYQGYVKKYGKFAFYWVDRAGHMVPADNPSAMYHILRDVTNNFEV